MQDTNFKPRAFLFDLNGTMINDMKYHNDAWHWILTDKLGANISYAEVKKEMYGKNEELLTRVFGKGHFTPEEVATISRDKELHYQNAFLPSLKLIDGLHNFLAKAKEHDIKMAIGSATVPFNIDFVIDGLRIRPYFDAIVSANDVKLSKPDPETFINAALKLGIKPEECIVFEDVPKGVEAAKRAGMTCFVLTTTHCIEEFDNFDNILGYIDDYNDPILTQCFKV